MASASLGAEKRSDTGKGVARKLRAAGRVPGIVYGHAREAQALSVNARDLDKLLSGIAAGSTVVELGLAGATTKTLIREIQRHPFKKVILHIDFQELVAGEKVTVDIPLVFVGIPEGVRLSGALLEQIMHSISVLADPSSIPNHIDVDVSNLDLHQSIHVRDLTLPAGVEVLENEGETICVVAPPRAEVEVVAPVEGAEETAEPEVIRAKKEEEDAEAAKK